MKSVILLSFMLISSSASAWWGGGYGPWGGMGYGPWSPMGYGYGYVYPPIMTPSFNNSVTIVQQPPPVIIERPQTVYEDRVIYRDREVCNQECERLRGYFGKQSPR